jgi:hypothetical protein
MKRRKENFSDKICENKIKSKEVFLRKINDCFFDESVQEVWQLSRNWFIQLFMFYKKGFMFEHYAQVYMLVETK